MLKMLSLFSHVALLVFFVYLQAQGASILGTDEEKPQPGQQHNASHK